MWTASLALNLGGLIQAGASRLTTQLAPSADMVSLLQAATTVGGAAAGLGPTPG